MNFNWIDWVIVAVGVYYVVRGWEEGLLRLGVSLLSFAGSLWLALQYHTLVGNFVMTKFGISNLWSTVIGYVVVAFAAELVIVEILEFLLARLPRQVLQLKINNFLGAILSVANAAIIIAFILELILALPIQGSVKADINDSYLGSHLVQLANKYGGQAVEQAKQFLTVAPKSNESISLSLNRATLNLSVDLDAENRMFNLVNMERAKVGVAPLKLDATIRSIARAHSQDMFERDYFSHYDPEGHDVGYRFDQANVSYNLAGENIAYAPDVNTAHQGLMNSEGHRKNILEPRFTRIGVGVINGGGNNEEMFTQDFAD